MIENELQKELDSQPEITKLNERDDQLRVAEFNQVQATGSLRGKSLADLAEMGLGRVYDRLLFAHGRLKGAGMTLAKERKQAIGIGHNEIMSEFARAEAALIAGIKIYARRPALAKFSGFAKRRRGKGK